MPHRVDLLRKESNNDFLPTHPHVTCESAHSRKPTDRWQISDAKYMVSSMQKPNSEENHLACTIVSKTKVNFETKADLP